MVERTDQQWKYPYVAAVVDFGSNFSLSVTDTGTVDVGYYIQPSIKISNTNATVIGFLDEFCENHGIEPNVRETTNTFVIEIGKRDDLKLFLQLVEPYVIAQDTAVQIMLKNLLPGLQMGKHTEKRGFLKMMGYVDEIREHTTQRSKPKYTQNYFRDEFGM